LNIWNSLQEDLKFQNASSPWESCHCLPLIFIRFPNLYFDLQGAFMLIITNGKIHPGGFEIIEKLVMVIKKIHVGWLLRRQLVINKVSNNLLVNYWILKKLVKSLPYLLK
jgi:hypothetical protein